MKRIVSALLVTIFRCIRSDLSQCGRNYELRQITDADGIMLEEPQWSPQEKVLYYTDAMLQKFYRLDPKTGHRQERYIDYGRTSIIIPVQNEPGIVLVSVRTGLYLLKWGAPGGDQALKQVTNVDLGKPDNNINDGKIDAYGRLWFGTLGKQFRFGTKPDQATFYSLTYTNFENPAKKIVPVTLSNGIAWSHDNKNMFYNDSPTRVVAKFDFDLVTGEIANRTELFNFDDYDIKGIPDGMTIDTDNNLWVATFDGASILKIDSKSGRLLDEIPFPVDQVTSVIFGGDNYTSLYVTTSRKNVLKPKPSSGALFEVPNTGSRGRPERGFLLPDVGRYL